MSSGNTVWLDRIAAIFGFDWLADRVPLAVSPAMLFVASVVFVDTFALEFGRYLAGGQMTFIRNPFVLLGEGGGGLLIAVYGIRQLHGEYENAKMRLQLDQRLADTSAFETLGSDTVRWVGYAVGAGVLLFQAVFVLGPAEILALDGYVGLLGNFVFIPFFYVPVVVDFCVTYFAIQVLLPRNIKHSELGLDFLDPENMGGLRPIGELLKHSYYYFVLLFVSFALFIYAPELFPGLFHSPFDPGLLANIAFTGGWVASAALLAYGIHTLHVFMQREKAEELQRLDRRVKEEVEEPWDIQNFKKPDDGEYEEIRSRMQYVTATREYPATFTIWSQLLISILIPKAIQTLLDMA